MLTVHCSSVEVMCSYLIVDSNVWTVHCSSVESNVWTVHCNSVESNVGKVQCNSVNSIVGHNKSYPLNILLLINGPLLSLGFYGF